MLEIQITIKAPELTEAINNLAAALVPSKPEIPKAVTEPDANPVQPVPMPEAPKAEAPAQAAAPIMPQPTAPVYTLDMLAKAMAALIDAGKMAQCMAAIQKYNVQAINQLDPGRYAEFAEDLKALGAQF